jgi:hypothetical protein
MSTFLLLLLLLLFIRRKGGHTSLNVLRGKNNMHNRGTTSYRLNIYIRKLRVRNKLKKGKIDGI